MKLESTDIGCGFSMFFTSPAFLATGCFAIPFLRWCIRVCSLIAWVYLIFSPSLQHFSSLSIVYHHAFTLASSARYSAGGGLPVSLHPSSFSILNACFLSLSLLPPPTLAALILGCNLVLVGGDIFLFGLLL